MEGGDVRIKFAKRVSFEKMLHVIWVTGAKKKFEQTNTLLCKERTFVFANGLYRKVIDFALLLTNSTLLPTSMIFTERKIVCSFTPVNQKT